MVMLAFARLDREPLSPEELDGMSCGIEGNRVEGYTVGFYVGGYYRYSLLDDRQREVTFRTERSAARHARRFLRMQRRRAATATEREVR